MNRSTAGLPQDASEEAARFERACEWFIELREQLNSPGVVAAWLEWCRADPRNREAFEQARRIWSATDGARAENLGMQAPAASRRWDSRAATTGLGLAAVVAGVAFFLPVLWHSLDPQPVPVLTTRAGENRAVRLDDGSSVILGGGSRVVARLSANSRHMTLERGEAYFQVAPDKLRPFVVSAGPVNVTAIGTEFNIRTGLNRVVVAVAQGAVRIDPVRESLPGLAPRKALRATAGESVALDTLVAQLQVAPVAPASIASWRKGRLEFTREPLNGVISSINRYSPREISLQGAGLGELRFTGTVFTDRLDDWMRGLPEIFPVTVREDASGVVIVAEGR